MRFIVNNIICLFKKCSGISINIQIKNGCTFAGMPQVSGFAEIGEFCYGYNINVHQAKIGNYCSIGLDETL